MWNLFFDGLLMLLVDAIRVVFATAVGWIVSAALPTRVRSRNFNQFSPYKLLLYFCIGAVALSAFWTIAVATLVG